MRILTTLDVGLNAILNLVLEKSASDPVDTTAGRLYYNTASDTIRYADGSNWNAFSATMTASQILSALLTVDGADSELDADKLDGLHAAAFALASHTHTAAQITDLITVIDGRITAAFTSEAVDATVDTIAEFTQLIKDNEDDIANILSIKRHQATIGDGSATDYTVTHNLNTLDCHVQVIEISSGETVITDVTRNGANSVIIGFGSAPASNTYRVIVLA